MRNHKKLLSPAKYFFVIFPNSAASPGRVCPTRDIDTLTSPSTPRGVGSATKAAEMGAAGDGPGWDAASAQLKGGEKTGGEIWPRR